MSTNNRDLTHALTWMAVVLVGAPALGVAQVPVDDAGDPYSEYSTAGVGDEGIPLLSSTELQELVGPIALYPDDLLAIVLPASTYPLQIVQAGRFLDELEDDPALEPDEAWDDSVVALLNYPEVIELLNDDLDWTWRLGEAVVAQQADVIAAVESFRDRAHAAGNLKSDAHQTVSHSDDGIIEIVPVDDEIIYVPYYEPESVVVYQPRPVYYYYPRPYPVYYYPYPSSYVFDRGFFWGVTTAFTIGWYTDRLHVFHHSYYGHPYYGRFYYDRWWYRRPTINVYNNYYVHGNVRRSRDHYRSGDYWRSREYRRLRSHDRRITRNRYYPGRRDSGYVTRDYSATTKGSTAKTRRDYRHKGFKAANAAPSGSRSQATRRNYREPAKKVSRDHDRAARRSVNSSGHRDTRNKIDSRDRDRSVNSSGHRNTRTRIDSRDRAGVATTKRKVAPDVRHGFTASRREKTYGSRSRQSESREKPVYGSVARRPHDSKRAEPRRNETASVRRVERQHAAAPRSERRHQAREAKGGERKASRANGRSKSRGEDARFRSRAP